MPKSAGDAHPASPFHAHHAPGQILYQRVPVGHVGDRFRA